MNALTFLALACCLSLTEGARPNFIVILVDDQDILLNGTSVMPSLHTHMVKGGTSFTGFVDVPICCPSRTSTLSARYSHNLNNTELGWCGNFGEVHENRTWIGALKDAGYATSLHGKYYNSYPSFCGKNVKVPSDFSYVNLMCDDNLYFGNTFNVNGTMTKVSDSTYLTNVIGNSSLSWLETVAGTSTPFFAYIAPHAPHVPATPAHEYENAPLPGGDSAPRTPNWNYATRHHHWLVSDKAPLTPKLIEFSDQLYARRLRATMSVDDIVEGVFQLLKEKGALDNTFVLYTSDHGYNLGQFMLPSGKFNAYENDIRVPFHVTGPGVTPGLALDAMVNNVDIGPTILDLAGLSGGGYVTDGKSFAGQLTPTPPPWPRDRLVFEYWGMGYTERGPCKNGTSPCPGGVQALEDAPSNSWSGLRIKNASLDVVYAEYRMSSDSPIIPASTNFTILFDMAKDPYQLVNLAVNQSHAGLLEALSGELWKVANCQGSECP